MRYLKIAALELPSSANSRSGWASDMLSYSLSNGLTPVPVPEALTTRFTVCLPDAVAESLQKLADVIKQSLAMTAAMLIAAAQKAKDPVIPTTPASTVESELVGELFVREVLRPLLRHAWTGLEAGHIIFAEAATGTGKGRLVASLATSAARKGGSTVVTAPLAVLHQLVIEIRDLQTEIKPLLLLGRGNFVDPIKLQYVLEDEENPALREWLNSGGLPHTPELKTLSSALQVPLCWLAEDAIALAEDLSIGDCLLDESADKDNPAEIAYRAAFEMLNVHRVEGSPSLILCSHLMLAIDSKLKGLHKDAVDGLLPKRIDTLIVDEAHLLELAFSTVHSSTLHLSTLERRYRDASLPQKTTRELIAVTNELIEVFSSLTEGKLVSGTIDNLSLLRDPLTRLADLLTHALSSKTKSELSLEARAARKSMDYARHTINSALTGYALLQLSTTPVRKHPLFTCGRNNLDTFFEKLWNQVGACVLTSATLYAPDATGQQTAKHLRWVLGVPKNRVCYHPPVIPPWVTSTATLNYLLGMHAPDDSEEWLDQTAAQIIRVYEKAKGGTLALCTSYATLEGLTKRLRGKYPHLLVQSPYISASRCARVFRQQATSGIRPLWLGVGAAWTGIDLADKDVPADKDKLLTDLYIPRIPYGCNRTLTHQRRREALGFMVEVHETARMLKQGLGRLVRREGLRNRHIWLADIRIQYPTPQLRPIVKLLASYKPPVS